MPLLFIPEGAGCKDKDGDEKNEELFQSSASPLRMILGVNLFLLKWKYSAEIAKPIATLMIAERNNKPSLSVKSNPMK